MQISKSLFIELLKESPTFRGHVANVVFGEDFLYKATDAVMNADGKIDAIKKIRTLSQENEADFRLTFPKAEWNHAYIPPVVFLSSAKNLVESIRSNW